jgi:hypothetical protein
LQFEFCSAVADEQQEMALLQQMSPDLTNEQVTQNIVETLHLDD